MKLKTVLIIDDDEDHIIIARDLFEKSGLCSDILDAPSGTKALDLLNEKKKCGDVNFLPDLILLDINMPEMNGFEFIESLKDLNDGIKPSSFVVMVTATCFTSDIKKINENEYIDGWLHKPYDIKTVEEMIDVAGSKGN